MAHVDFFYDLVCPYAYLAHRRIEDLCAAEGATLSHQPILLGGVFRAIGAPDVPMEAMAPAKQAVTSRDLARWAERLGMPLRFPDGHPRRTVLALRALRASGDVPRATRALYAAYWERGEDVADESVVRRALDEVGLDGSAAIARAGTEAAKLDLRAATDRAVALGVFGVPSFLVTTARGAQLFWGQDRLGFVRKAIGGWWVEPPPGEPLSAEGA